jgi:sugar (pentulose or hexulose) kinase
MIEECEQKGLLGDSSPTRIAVTGGGSEVDYLLQYVADVSGQSLIKLQAREASARGAALAAIASSYPKLDLMTLNDSSAAREYRCDNPERRNRYLMWLKMERDALQGALPASVEIEAR